MALRSHGYQNVVGIEPSMGCRETLAAQKIVAYLSVADCLAREMPFDCVVCSQVLEHVYSLDSFLDNLGRLLSSDGIIYVETPDAAGYEKAIHAPYYYFDREHINHFTRVSMTNLFLTRLAFRPVYSEARLAASVHGFQTPNVFAVYRRAPSFVHVEPDDVNAAKICSYVRQSEALDTYPQLKGLQDGLQSRDAPVLLWGYGAHLRRLLRKGVSYKLTISGIVDRNKGGRGEKFMGLPILATEDIKSPPFQNATVIITSVLYACQIEETLAKQSFAGRVIRISD